MQIGIAEVRVQPDIRIEQRVKNLFCGFGIGAITGTILRNMGAQFWEVGFGISSLFTTVLVYGPTIQAAVSAAPLIAMGAMTKAVVQKPFEVTTALPQTWTERIAGVTGLALISIFQFAHLVAANSPFPSCLNASYLGPAIATAFAIVNTAGVDFGGTVAPGSVEGIFWNIFLSTIIDIGIHHFFTDGRGRNRIFERDGHR